MDQDWTATLPGPIGEACDPLFRVLPLSQAMPSMQPVGPAGVEALEAASGVVSNPIIAGCPTLVAGIWLYVDDLDRSHRASQSDGSREAAMWHSIMHRREGDFSNSRYWLRQASGLLAFEEVEGYDPARMIHQAEQAAGQSPPELVELQRREWVALFRWCALRA